MAIRTIGTPEDMQRIQAQSGPFTTRAVGLQARVMQLVQDFPSSLPQLERQIRETERLSAEALQLYQEMETFKNQPENQEIFRDGAGIDRGVCGFDMMQNGLKGLSSLAATFKRDDVPQIREFLDGKKR